MSSDDLGLFSYEILALVGAGGASAHDLRRLAQEVRMVAWAGESQYYVEPKRLARLRYLEARRAPGRTRASLAALRAELAELEAQLDAAAAGAEALPHRARYLRLAQDFLRRLIELHRELIDEVERELAS